MSIGKFGPYECRLAEAGDIKDMVLLLEDMVCDARNPDMYAMERRKLNKIVTDYVMKATGVVVTKDNLVVGAYVGVNNFIHYIGNRGDVFSMAILMKTVLCDIHNKYTDSTFQVLNNKHRKIYDGINSKNGKATSIDESGNGTVFQPAKESIEELFNELKVKYE